MQQYCYSHCHQEEIESGYLSLETKQKEQESHSQIQGNLPTDRNIMS